MDSDQLFHIRNLFNQGNYSTCISTATPLIPSPPSTPEDVTLAIYVARAHLALTPPETDKAIKLLLTGWGEDQVEVKAVTLLAQYIASPSETILDSLRDILIELEDSEPTPETSIAKAAAATAFVRAGELEEAVDVLSGEDKSLECVAILVQIYLSIDRIDLAKKTYEAAKAWGDDSLLVQMMEAWIGLRVQGSSLQPSYYFYDELLLGPSGRTPSILSSHAAAHLLLSHADEARSDIEIALTLKSPTGEDLASDVNVLGVIAGVLGAGSKGDGYVKELKEKFPEHPMVKDLERREEAFDLAAAKFAVAA